MNTKPKLWPLVVAPLPWVLYLWLIEILAVIPSRPPLPSALRILELLRKLTAEPFAYFPWNANTGCPRSAS